MGSSGMEPEDAPSLDEVLVTYAAIHAESVAHLRSLNDEQLSAPHQAMMELPAGSDVRTVVMHHILHESGHCGQLDVLCKLYGKPLR